jgi:hypothetical protein
MSFGGQGKEMFITMRGVKLPDCPTINGQGATKLGEAYQRDALGGGGSRLMLKPFCFGGLLSLLLPLSLSLSPISFPPFSLRTDGLLTPRRPLAH